MDRNVYRLLQKIKEDYQLPDQFDFVLIGTVVWYAHDLGVTDVNKLLASEVSQEALTTAVETIKKERPELAGVFEELSPVTHLEPGKWKQLLQTLKTIRKVNISYGEWADEIVSHAPALFDAGNGENASPISLNDLAISLLSPESGSFYDGAAGLGGSLVAANHHARQQKNSIHIYGQELNAYNWAVAKLRLFLHGISTKNLAKGDSLSQPVHTESGELKKFDYVFLDGPFGMQIQDYETVKQDPYHQFSYGVPNKKSGDTALMMHVASRLNATGKGLMTVTDGALFRGGSEAEIRKRLLEEDIIEAVISLAPKLYEKTAHPVNMLLFNKAKPADRKGRILFINAEKLYMERTRSKRLLLDTHIWKIIENVQKGLEQEEKSVFISLADVKEANLLPNRYLVPTTLDIPGYGNVKVDPEKLEKIDTVPLTEKADFFPGFNILSKHKESSDGAHRIVKLSDVQDGNINIDSVSRFHIPGKARLDKYELQKGDVILAIRGTSLKTAVIPKHAGTLLLSQNFIGIRCRGELDPYYLKAYLDSPPGQYLLRSKLSGTTVLTLSKKDVQNLAIPNIKLSEQQSIVGRFRNKETNITEQIRNLQEKLKESKLEMYKEIGIRNVFEIKDQNRNGEDSNGN